MLLRLRTIGAKP